jgi:hypothetical protein
MRSSEPHRTVIIHRQEVRGEPDRADRARRVHLATARIGQSDAGPVAGADAGSDARAYGVRDD